MAYQQDLAGFEFDQCTGREDSGGAKFAFLKNRVLDEWLPDDIFGQFSSLRLLILDTFRSASRPSAVRRILAYRGFLTIHVHPFYPIHHSQYKFRRIYIFIVRAERPEKDMRSVKIRASGRSRYSGRGESLEVLRMQKIKGKKKG